ncbi:hypothetical protein ABZP36_010350 [Zizania latifolia]
MADTLLLVLRKVAFSLGEGALEKLGTEMVEAASVLTDFEHSVKQIESEFMIMQAFISQVTAEKVGDKTFDAWLDQVRDVAHDVEDIVDEYAYLTAQATDTGSFFKRKFQQTKSISAWQNISSQISQVENRIQRLSAMRNRYGISTGEMSRSNTCQHSKQLSVSDSAYLTDDTEIVGNASVIGRLTQWILEERHDRSVMSIFGMGGVGKTTTAGSIFKNRQLITAFDCYAWITLSQDYEIEDLLRQIIKQLMDHKLYLASSIEAMNRARLIEQLQGYLTNRKYLIVLDDVWDTDAWLFLNYAFVRNNRGSRVLITTRKKDVAFLADHNCVVELKTLPYTEAWHLFCKKAFRRSEDKRCPENLRPWAEKIVAKCQGLPLAIIAIGSLLSYHEFEEEWKLFYNQLGWQLANNPELNWVVNILSLSLNDLPSYLRSCFLYCSLFPEDCRLKRKMTAELWIAEGLVEERGDGTTMEEVAECYLTELTQRSLLDVIERNGCGRAKTFRMHDLVREVATVIAKKERFACSYDNVGVTQAAHEFRRLWIQKGAQSLRYLGSSKLRSFVLLDTAVPPSWIHDASSRFRLLRVLCLRFASIEQVPSVVTELYNLRYLDLSHTKVKHIPASFRNLINLQVLNLRYSYVEELPLEITLLTNLQHLHVGAIHDVQERLLNCISATKISGNICRLKNLQALQTVSANKDVVSQLGNLTLMRSLFIMKVQQSYIAELCNALTKMPSLSRLLISSLDKDEILNLEMLKPLSNLKLFWLAGKLEGGVLPPIFSKLEKLTQLKLDWSGLKKDPIGSFSYMLNLVNLVLTGAYDGEQLTFRAGWFPKLNLLQLADMEHLNWIEIEDGSMVCLCQLELVGLRNLNEVPKGIRYIRTLYQMFITDMPKEFIAKIQGSDRCIVQHVPNIHIFDSSDFQAVNNFICLPHLARKYGPGATKILEVGDGGSLQQARNM